MSGTSQLKISTARVLAHRGELEEAVRLAAEAAALIEGTQELLNMPDLLMWQAEVLELAGSVEDAKAALTKAVELPRARGRSSALRWLRSAWPPFRLCGSATATWHRHPPFTDIEGSTVLADRLDEGWPDLLAEHNRLLRTAFAAHGGTQLGTEGDAFFVSFTAAGSAAAAAAEAQRALASHAWPDNEVIRVRMGLHTGEPTPTPEGYVGIDMHRAARVTAAAHGGQVPALTDHPRPPPREPRRPHLPRPRRPPAEGPHRAAAPAPALHRGTRGRFPVPADDRGPRDESPGSADPARRPRSGARSGAHASRGREHADGDAHRAGRHRQDAHRSAGRRRPGRRVSRRRVRRPPRTHQRSGSRSARARAGARRRGELVALTRRGAQSRASEPPRAHRLRQLRTCRRGGGGSRRPPRRMPAAQDAGDEP